MRILLFGIIAERAGTDRLEMDAATLGELRQMLAQRIDGLERLRFAIAVDRRIVNGDIPLTGTEEIALLPPFAGG